MGSEMCIRDRSWTQDGDRKNWDMRVGEIEYREFNHDDRYGGSSRIERFTYWMNRYVARAAEIDNTA